MTLVCPQKPLGATHWGLCRPVVQDGVLTDVLPYEGDLMSSPNLSRLAGWVNAKRRIATPQVRRGFLEKGTASRTGRGRDDFVEVSWERALGLAAQHIARVYEERGPAAVYGKTSGWKSCGLLNSPIHLVRRLLNLCGGFVPVCGTYSTGAVSSILPYVVGMSDPPAEPWSEVIENASRVVFWGADPLITNDVDWFSTLHASKAALLRLKEKGTPTIFINPVRGETAKMLSSRWVAVRPSTDCALMLAMIYVLIDKGAADLNECRRLAHGVDAFVDYVLGREDGLPKTAHWAQAVTGIDACEIENLALELARERTMLCFGWGPQRARFGEQFHFMGYALALFLGQIGKPGCGISTHHHYSDGGAALCSGPMLDAISSLKPVKRPDLPSSVEGMPPIPVARLADLLAHPGKAIEHNGRTIVYPDIDLIVWAGGNPFSHQSNTLLLQKGFRRPSAVIVADTHWSAAARHADIVLPAASCFERNDITPIGTYSRMGLAAMHQVVDPIGKARSDFAVFSALARELGLKDAFDEGLDQEGWLRRFYAQAQELSGVALPDFDDFWREGVVLFKEKSDDPAKSFWRRFAENPAKAPLPTPSGKIEVASSRLAALGYEEVPSHPAYKACDLADARQYPLTLLSIKSAKRLHSQLARAALEEARDAVFETCRMHPKDAASRGICSGDEVVVFNSLGRVLARAEITSDLIRGVVVLEHGAWFDPDPEDERLDRGSAANVLITDAPTSRLANANIASGTGVEVQKSA